MRNWPFAVEVVDLHCCLPLDQRNFLHFTNTRHQKQASATSGQQAWYTVSYGQNRRMMAATRPPWIEAASCWVQLAPAKRSTVCAQAFECARHLVAGRRLSDQYLTALQSQTSDRTGTHAAYPAAWLHADQHHESFTSLQQVPQCTSCTALLAQAGCRHCSVCPCTLCNSSIKTTNMRSTSTNSD